MQRHQDTIGGGRRLGLLGVSALALLAGCDWIGGGSTPVGPPPRPGAETGVQPSASLPPGPVNPQYDAGVVGGDDRTTPAIGSIIPPKGGQKAQREAIEKEQAERDRKEREARLEREAAEKEDKAREKQEGTPPALAPAGAPPPGAGTITSDQPPVSAPVPPPAPVTTVPVAPPSAAPDPAPAAPAPSGDPDKAYAPQPGWTPPGVDVGSVDRLAPLMVAFTPSADDACAAPPPVKADIARAQSGEVPFSTLKSPAFGGGPIYQANTARGLAANRRVEVFIDF